MAEEENSLAEWDRIIRSLREEVTPPDDEDEDEED